MCGVVPQVAAMVGRAPRAPRTFQASPTSCPMVKGVGSMALGGPAAGQGGDRARGQRAGARRLARCTPRRAASGRRVRRATRRASRRSKKYLSFFPSNCDEHPPDRARHRSDRSSRRVAPRSPARVDAQAVRHVQAHSSDRRPRRLLRHQAALRAQHHHVPRAHRRERVGIVANQPNYLGGILENDSADKAARFIQICDAFNVPLVFLQDVPGFMVGSKVEHAGIIRHGAKMLHVMSAATVPKITVRRPQGLRRGLLRDVRPRLRAGPDRRRGRAREISGDGRRRHGRHRRAKALRRRGATARSEEDDRRADPEAHRHLQGRRLGPRRRSHRPARHAPAIAWGLELARHKKVERPARKRGVIPV